MLLDEPTAKCFVLHENNIPKEDDKDPIKLFGFISCLVECIYTKRHYIGKNSETLNMKAVKADAENLYAARPKEKQYHVELYEFCRKEAFKLYTLIKASPAGLVIFKNSCKPYFVFVYLCQIEYHKKKTCPYFMWQGNEDDETMLSQCKAAKEQCYKIDGLTPPEQK
ncbi:uncharacterized protein LOC101458235 [Ceratitis capitata]|nr:uncharacterized protein LOC101458235 [Ceratitis capitata]